MRKWVKIAFGTIGLVLLLTIAAIQSGQFMWGEQIHFVGPIDTAKIQISNFMDALALFRKKLGRYPSTEEGLKILVDMPERRKPLMRSISLDPWGNEYVYIHPGDHNPGSFDISSKGADGVLGTEDDINNW